MKTIILLISPLIFLFQIIILNTVVEMLRQPSDIAVLVGVVLLCALITGNYYLLKLIYNQFKTKTK